MSSATPKSDRAKRPMSRNLKLSLIVLAVFGIAVAAVLAAVRFSSPEAPADPAAAAARPDSHRLSAAPGSKVTFVEFLDFECESCGRVFPDVEELRQRYAGRVEFVMRYFPLPSHFNAERAARAVEAAARQDRLEPMYKMMFETQAEWGEQQVAMDERFRGYAQQLGLDMARFDADYNDPSTLERVEADIKDGEALGVKGTPSFFVNGQKLEPESFDAIIRTLDTALAGGR